MRSDSMPRAQTGTQASMAEAEFEHDEYHSSLEVDDTIGWRVFVVPALAALFVIGALAILVLYGA